MAVNESGGWDGRADNLGGYVEPAKWPKVIGVLSIVQGSLGCLFNACCGVFFVAGPAFFESMMKNMPKGNGTPRPGQDPREGIEMMSLMKPWMAAQGALMLLTLGTSVWLLVAGVSMVRRNRSTVGMHKGWAWTRIVLLVLGTLLSIVSTVVTAGSQAQIKTTYGTGGTTGGVMAQGLVIAVVGFVLFVAYPVVVLMVLGKPWAKSEVARWTDGGDVAEEDVDFK